MSMGRARTVADAVLYEGYLLYPYRATSSKNQSRWQWGVLGPPGAAAAGAGEESTMSTQCLLRSGVEGRVSVRLRFLQLQTRCVEHGDPGHPAGYRPVSELRAGERTWLSWDEAVAHEVELQPCRLTGSHESFSVPVHISRGEDIEELSDSDGRTVGRLVRRRCTLDAVVQMTATRIDEAAGGGTAGELVRLEVVVDNIAAEQEQEGGETTAKERAVRSSFIGTHLLLEADDAEFVSLLEPPDELQQAAAECRQQRLWPVLAGEAGRYDVVLASPIILYDYPEVAEQSTGALFDSTEIDEILTLRVMTLTDEEKTAARATDPRAAEIIDRCDAMAPESMQALHGILRDPHAGVDATSSTDFGSLDPVAGTSDINLRDVPVFTDLPDSQGAADIRGVDPPSFDTGGAAWWDPATDASVQPEHDTVLVDGVTVGRDSIVRIHPLRRADAQDLFFAGQTARVTAVLSDVDGQVHVAVVLVDDPAADMHEWYGRYLYFAPEELEPLDAQPNLARSGTTAAPSDTREESRS